MRAASASQATRRSARGAGRRGDRSRQDRSARATDRGRDRRRRHAAGHGVAGLGSVVCIEDQRADRPVRDRRPPQRGLRPPSRSLRLRPWARRCSARAPATRCGCHCRADAARVRRAVSGGSTMVRLGFSTIIRRARGIPAAARARARHRSPCCGSRRSRPRRELRGRRIDVLVLDSDPGRGDALALCRRVKARPGGPSPDLHRVRESRAHDRGASGQVDGLLDKSAPAAALLDAIRRVADGETVIPPSRAPTSRPRSPTRRRRRADLRHAARRSVAARDRRRAAKRRTRGRATRRTRRRTAAAPALDADRVHAAMSRRWGQHAAGCGRHLMEKPTPRSTLDA